jgi:hypothetical protein
MFDAVCPNGRRRNHKRDNEAFVREVHDKGLATTCPR